MIRTRRTSEPLALEGEGRSPFTRIGAVLLVGVLLTLIAGMAWLRTFPPMATVMSESMAPTIGVGDIVLFQKLSEPPQVGDIVQLSVPAELQKKHGYPSTVIHRVSKVNGDGTLETKGDNLSTADPFETRIDAVSRKVVFTVPVAGRLLGFVFSPFGLLWLAIGLLIFVVMPFYDVQKERAELHQIELASLDDLKHKLDDLEAGVSSGAHGGMVPFVPMVDLTQPIVAEADPEVKETLQELVSAVGEYGHHLRSHTAVLQSMSAASQDLAQVVADLKAQMRGEAVTPEPTRAGAAALPPQAAPVLEWLGRTAYAEWSLLAPAKTATELGQTADDVRAAIESLAAANLIELDPVSPPDLYRYRVA